MFEGSGRLDPVMTYPALAGAIAEIPVRPARGESRVAEEARALMVLRRQLDARLLARIAAVDEQGLAEADGFSSTAAWVRGFANLDAQQATGVVGAARVAERLPKLGQVLVEGKIGVEHLQAVSRAAAQTPPEVLAVHEGALAGLAPHARPGDMAAAAKTIQARYDTEAVARDARHLHEARRLSLAKTFGDAFHLEGILEPEAGAALAAALEPLMRKRGDEDDRTPPQRRADALIELVGVALRDSERPDCGGDRPRLTFLVRTGALSPLGDPLGGIALGDIAGAVTGSGRGAAFAGSQSGVTGFEGNTVEGTGPDGNSVEGSGFGVSEFGVSGFGHEDSDNLLLGTTAMLPAETVARIGCDADLNVAVVNEYGEPLNYGRTRRNPPPHQRRAVVLRDKHCVFPHCDRPPSQCECHHLDPWASGGPTDLVNLALLCKFHHHLVHEGRWLLERQAPGPPTVGYPAGTPPGWLATAPDGRQLRELRQPAA
ncbi:hypothetical protein acdb102_17700 [Acidothermaceae bacterium B102]|nr:hypothetical protein acdb102_17700 [Acidothermaceae bacterium B102]